MDTTPDQQRTIIGVAPNGSMWQVSDTGEVISQHTSLPEAQAQARLLAADARPSTIVEVDHQGEAQATQEFNVI